MELTKRDWRAVAEKALYEAVLKLRCHGGEDEIRHLIARAKQAMEECEKASD